MNLDTRNMKNFRNLNNMDNIHHCNDRYHQNNMNNTENIRIPLQNTFSQFEQDNIHNPYSSSTNNY